MARKVGIGIIGFGKWARSAYGPALADMGDVDVVAVAARSDETLAAAREAISPDLTVCHNYHDLLADHRVDAVLVATPNNLHREVATWALKAGKHVFLEGPIDESPELAYGFLDEVERLATGGQENLVFQMDFELGYVPVLHRLKSMLAEGALGAPLSISVRLWCDWGVGGQAKTDESNRLGLFVWLAPWYVHVLDVLIGRLPERVEVTGVRALNGTLMDHGWASLDYGKADGPRLVGRFEFNLLAAEGQAISVDVVGTQGEGHADLSTGEMRWRSTGSSGWQDEVIPPAEPVVAFAGMRECLAGFVRAITHGESVLADLAASRRVHQVCFTAQRAADEGILVALNAGE